MELSRLSRKEIINLYDGSRLGYVGEADLVIDAATGAIKSMVITPRAVGLKMSRGIRELVVPWEAVRKIGDEVMIVEISPVRALRRPECNE